METIGINMLRRSILDDGQTENTRNDDIVAPSPLEAFWLPFPKLADEIEKQWKDALHIGSVVFRQSGRAEHISDETNMCRNSNNMDRLLVSDSNCDNETNCDDILYGGSWSGHNFRPRCNESARNQLHHILWQSFYKEKCLERRTLVDAIYRAAICSKSDLTIRNTSRTR